VGRFYFAGVAAGVKRAIIALMSGIKNGYWRDAALLLLLAPCANAGLRPLASTEITGETVKAYIESHKDREGSPAQLRLKFEKA